MGRPRTGHTGRILSGAVAVLVAASGVLVAPVVHLVPAQPVRAAAAFADPFFREDVIFSGLSNPTSVRFASNGRAFVIEKSGRIKTYDSITDTTPTTVADLTAEVMDYWDRGMLGLAIDPDFPTQPYLYVFYVHGSLPGQSPARWGDGCPAAPTGPGGTADGCPASSKVDRITLDASNVMTARTTLVWDFCQQFPSHSGSGMAFGPDKQLYVAAGEGASFNGMDYGQRGGTVPDPGDPLVPVNPCGDPVTVTSPSGATPTVSVSTAQGGMLRSQDIRTTSDAVGLSGSLIRVDPHSGAPSAGNPITSGSNNAKRTVAHGFRNPFRITFRPGTSDLYVANVGNVTWEAIVRLGVPGSATPTTLPNAGWPCYEGPGRHASFEALGTSMCASLYAAGSAAWKKPFYSYSHFTTKAPTGPCYNPVNGTDGGAVTGLAFYQGPKAGTAAYPSKYTGGLFFADYDRDCLAFLPKTSTGVPDPTQMQQVASGLSNPVDLVTGPDGNLFYVDHDGGRVMRIRYLLAPTARITADPVEARAPVTVQLSGTTSTDPDPAATLVAYRWDLDGDGQYDDATGSTYAWSITNPAVYPVRLEVESSNGLKDTAVLTYDATNSPPAPQIDAPVDSLTWAVGDMIHFEGGATDAQDGDLPGSALTWSVVMRHCPADCHDHTVETKTGLEGDFEAPDHEYPSKLELRLTATDTHGTKRTVSVELQPKTRDISITSSPSGVPVSVASTTADTPSTTTVLENGDVTITPALAPTIGGTRHRFWAWADSSTRVREMQATDDIALAATYLPDRADTCASAPASSSRTWLIERANGNGDSDWFRFSLGASRRVLVTLGDLPVNARVDLYSSCSTRLASSDHDGTRFEEITRRLGKGTYRVKVSFPGGGRSQTPYVLRFQPLSAGMVVKSSRTTSGPTGGAVRIVGEVLNNTGATRGRPTVTATFRNASGSVVGTLSAKAFARRLGDGGVTPFVIAGTVPTYARVSFAVSAGSPPSARPLDLTSLTRTVNSNGTVTEKGRVRNTGTVTAREVAVARTWYGKRGEVLGRGSAFVSPSTLAPGASGTFTILRPVLPTVQATRTALRAS